jgi:hypothetical protein
MVVEGPWRTAKMLTGGSGNACVAGSLEFLTLGFGDSNCSDPNVAW